MKSLVQAKVFSPSFNELDLRARGIALTGLIQSLNHQINMCRRMGEKDDIESLEQRVEELKAQKEEVMSILKQPQHMKQKAMYEEFYRKHGNEDVKRP